MSDYSEHRRFGSSIEQTANRDNHQSQGGTQDSLSQDQDQDQLQSLEQDRDLNIDQDLDRNREQEQAILSDSASTIHVNTNAVHTVLTPPDSLRLAERRPSAIDETRPTLDADADSRPGHVRYYGPTTQLYLQSGSTPGGEETNVMSDFHLDMDSPQLRESLIRLSWSYYARSVNAVDEQLFMSHRAVGLRSQYYSNFLECSLLACATRLRGSSAMKPLGRSFAERAKSDLVFELENPTIATIQGLLLLSEFEATSARDRIGWTYSGISSSSFAVAFLLQRLTLLTRRYRMSLAIRSRTPR